MGTTIRFTTEIGEDQTIHPPAGVHLAPGRVEVIVLPATDASEQKPEHEPGTPSVPEIAQDLARFAREQNVQGLPVDMALNHDHYLHGAPRGLDQP